MHCADRCFESAIVATAAVQHKYIISGCLGQDQRAARAGGVGRERARQPQHDLGRVLRREDRGVAQPAQPQQGPQEPRHDRHQGEEPQKS